MAKKQKRFIIKEEETLSLGLVTILMDTVTGVNYLASMDTKIHCLTPLLDHNGNVVIDKVGKDMEF